MPHPNQCCPLTQCKYFCQRSSSRCYHSPSSACDCAPVVFPVLTIRCPARVLELSLPRAISATCTKQGCFGFMNLFGFFTFRFACAWSSSCVYWIAFPVCLVAPACPYSKHLLGSQVWAGVKPHSQVFGLFAKVCLVCLVCF